MKVILPFEFPIITIDSWIAISVGIMQTIEGADPWMCNSFIHLQAVEDDVRISFNLQNNFLAKSNTNPLLQSLIIPKKMVFKTYSVFSEFVKESINDNYYVFLLLNHYYLSPSINYCKKHILHHTFLYGYESNQIFVSDFWFHENYKYTLAQISSKELNISVSEELVKKNDQLIRQDINNNIILLKIKDGTSKFLKNKTINLYQLKLQIQNYLDSNTSFCTHFYIDKNKFYFYGIQIYNEVINRIEKVFNKHNAKNIYQFLSHKIMMCYRIRLLNKYKLIKNYTEIYDIFHEIVRLSTILENLQIKYIICKKLKILESAKNIFQKIKNLEYSGLHLLLKNL